MNPESKKTILLAEDDYSLRKYLAGVMSKNGFNVLEAEDGREACSIYEKKNVSIDVIASDLLMPNVSGSELAKFNYENRLIPFVLFTAVNDAEQAIELLKLGVHDYVVKPIEETAFIGVLKNAIRRRGLNEHAENHVNPYAGNIGSVTIPSEIIEIDKVIMWVVHRITEIVQKKELYKFTTSLKELLLNAYEHGNLGIGEKEKTDLLVSDAYDSEISRLEKTCKSKIKVDVCVLKDEVAVNITDEGSGFDYEKYIKMTEEGIRGRLEMPNGPGDLYRFSILRFHPL